ncbi:hypothetical protein L9G15_22655, partial [Shewanella sp. A3A]|nr:hypothetical protein [Shewanella ferrihydritica]
RFSRSFTKQEQNTGNLPGFIHWEPVILMLNLRLQLIIHEQNLDLYTLQYYWIIKPQDARQMSSFDNLTVIPTIC